MGLRPSKARLPIACTSQKRKGKTIKTTTKLDQPWREHLADILLETVNPEKGIGEMILAFLDESSLSEIFVSQYNRPRSRNPFEARELLYREFQISRIDHAVAWLNIPLVLRLHCLAKDFNIHFLRMWSAWFNKIAPTIEEHFGIKPYFLNGFTRYRFRGIPLREICIRNSIVTCESKLVGFARQESTIVALFQSKFYLVPLSK